MIVSISTVQESPLFTLSILLRSTMFLISQVCSYRTFWNVFGYELVLYFLRQRTLNHLVRQFKSNMQSLGEDDHVVILKGDSSVIDEFGGGRPFSVVTHDDIKKCVTT